MATGDVWKAIFNMQWGTVECRPGIHLIEGTGGIGLNPAENVATAINDALSGTALDGFSDQCHLTGVTVQDIQPGILPTQVFAIGPRVGNVVDVNPLPPQSAGVISLQTGVKGVTGVFATAGRLYMPGIPQNGQISGFLEATFQDTLSAFAQKLFDQFVLDGTAYQWNIISYTPGSRPVTVRAFNPVTAFTINNVVRSQRRREFGVGI